MVGRAPIPGDCFTVEVDLDLSVLIAQEVLGLADAADKLTELGRLSSNVISIITLLEVDAEGQITLAKVGVAGPRESKKVMATQLFPLAPVTARLRMKPDWRAFNFPPGRTVSEWLSSDNVDWNIMKTNNKNGGTYDAGEHKDIGVSNWSCRLVVNPTGDPGEATMSLVAVPRPKNELGNLAGNAAGEGSTGFPVVLLGKFRADFGGQLDEPRNDGLAHYPVLVNRGPPGALQMPNNRAILRAMRSLWSSCFKARCLNAVEWVTATQGPQEPVQTPVESDWAWPEPAVERSLSEGGFDDDEDSGEYMSILIYVISVKVLGHGAPRAP